MSASLNCIVQVPQTTLGMMLKCCTNSCYYFLTGQAFHRTRLILEIYETVFCLINRLSYGILPLEQGAQKLKTHVCMHIGQLIIYSFDVMSEKMNGLNYLADAILGTNT